MRASAWSRSLALAGLGLLLALVLLLAAVPGIPVRRGLGPGGGAEARMRGVSLAGPGGGLPWRLEVAELVVQRRKLMVFGIAGNYEMVLRGVQARLRSPVALAGLLREAGPLLWKRWPGVPVRFEGLTLRVGPEGGAWTLTCASAELRREKTMLLQGVTVLEPDGRTRSLPLASWDPRSADLQPVGRAR